MPTENRSSTEMVSVPRDLIDLTLAHLPSDSAAKWEIHDLLAQSADQHQGEPVAHCFLRKNGYGEWVNDSRHWEDGAPGPAILAASEKYPELYQVRLAFGSPADAGEVERLRESVGQHRATAIASLEQVLELQRDVEGLQIKLAERDVLLGSAKSALCHLLHNIKISGKRIDLGLAIDSADTVITLINALQAEAKS